jgi:putative cell wall-binding protein
MLVRRALVGAVALAAALAGPAAPVRADSQPATDLRPVPGEVVASGSVPVSARVTVPGAVVLRVDGVDAAVSATSPGANAPTTVRALPTLPPGDHVAQVFVDGRVVRAWRFTVSGVDVVRLSAPDDIGTALAISRDRYRVDGSAGGAVLARPDDHAGALAGAPLAAALAGPLLYSDGPDLEPGVAAELGRVLQPGSPVVLLGGPDALGQAVEEEIAALGFTPQRAQGETGADVAAAVARVLRPAAAPARPGTVVVAAHDAVPDALAVAAQAAAQGWPVLLTDADTLDDATRSYLVQVPAAEVVVAGGPDAVSSAVLYELRDLAGQVHRTHVRDRAGSARGSDAVAVAGAQDVATALAGAVHAAASDVPLLLAGDAPVPPSSPARRVVVYGGERAVGDEVVGAFRRAIIDDAGPVLEGIEPAPGTRVSRLDEVVVRFDRPVLPAHSSLYVSIGGREVTGTLAAREQDALILDVASLPALADGRRYELRVVAAATDGERWTHVDETLTWLEPRPLSQVPSGAGP